MTFSKFLQRDGIKNEEDNKIDLEFERINQWGILQEIREEATKNYFKGGLKIELRMTFTKETSIKIGRKV